MNVNEVSKKLDVSASKVYQLASARKISHYRIGGKIVFTDADVDAYLASCRVAKVAPVATAPRISVKLKHLNLV
jgi:excisionase family DNA binding protein